MGLPKRAEVPVELTWDLTRIFADEAAYESCVAELEELTKDIAGRRGTLATAADVLAVLELLNEYRIKVSWCDSYCSLSAAVDMTDEAAGLRGQRLMQIVSEQEARLAFLENEILALPTAVLTEAMAQTDRYAHFLQVLADKKEHLLSEKEEALLAKLSPVLSAPLHHYENTKLGDMQFPDFEVDGKNYPNSFVLFENVYQFEADTKVRRAAFAAFSKVLRQYHLTIADDYISQVQREKIESELRGYDSVIDFLLAEQRVPADLYHRQIDLIMEKLAPVMRRYAQLLQKEYGLDRLCYEDLKLPLERTLQPQVTIEESKQYVEKALAQLGEEYLDMAMGAYRDRWVDYAQNEGKSTGGFCASPYGKGGFILLSWTGLLSEVYTMVHEIGHGVHFMLAQRENSALEEEPSLYIIEAPSTANELLLSQALLKEAQDDTFRRYVLSSMIGNTYYHNFVTHLLEAAYQREVYRLVDRKEALSAARLDALKKEVLQKFWGDTVELTEGAELTWMRQPHYYMGLYPYTYSAGLTVATAVVQRMQTDATAVQDWLKLLRAGGSKDVVELALLAGVDLHTEAPLLTTINYLAEVVDEIAALTERMGK
ncbi:MAG: oligoendopeptidase F [Eubacteriales bacterium]|nr:oligoendopeptidase F [Eubacteriales bacterium]